MQIGGAEPREDELRYFSGFGYATTQKKQGTMPETQELRSIVNYQNALTDLFRAQGILLNSYNIDLP